MFSHHKNSYLQSRTRGINPRIINRSVDLARNQVTIDSGDFEPPWNRLTSEQPCIPIRNIDVTRRPLAFGRWALPKLCRELHNPDPNIVLEAVTSISDLVHDPEKGYEAIRLRIPDRMADLLNHPKAAIRERVCMALTTIAGLGSGRDAIVKNKKMLKNLAKLAEDKFDIVKMKMAALLEMLSRNWMACDYLVEEGFVSLLLENVINESDEIAILYLETLICLMYGEGKDEALYSDGFKTFMRLIKTASKAVRPKALYCLMMITSTPTGKDNAYSSGVLQRLHVLLNDEDEETYTSAAAAMMFCTIKSRAKLRAREMPNLPERLITLSNDWNNKSTQIYCVKALTNICEHPEIRQEVREKYLDQIENIHVGADEELKTHKDTLLKVVKWVPWSNT